MRPLSKQTVTALLFAAFTAPILLILWYVRTEDTVYVWDTENFHNLAREALGSWNDSWRKLIGHTLMSLEWDYSILFAAPLVPVLAVFGDSRATLLVAIYVVYVVPTILITARFFPAFPLRSTGLQRPSRTVSLVRTFSLALLPAFLTPLLLGYPDTGVFGAVFAAFLLALNDTRLERRRNLILIPLLLVTAILMRRGSIHLAFSLYLCWGMVLVLSALRRGETLSTKISPLFKILLTAAATGALLWVLAPRLTTNIVTLRFASEFSSYNASPEAWPAIFFPSTGWLFPAVMILIFARFLADPVHRRDARFQFLFLFSLLTPVVWIFTGKHWGDHRVVYVLPLLISGICLGIDWLGSRSSRKVWLAVPVMGLLFLLRSPAGVDTDALGYVADSPQIRISALPSPMRPVRRPDLEELKRIHKELAEAHGTEPVIVLGESDALSGTLLRSLATQRKLKGDVLYTGMAFVDSQHVINLAQWKEGSLFLVPDRPHDHFPTGTNIMYRAWLKLFEPNSTAQAPFEALSTESPMKLHDGTSLTLFRMRSTPSVLLKFQSAKNVFEELKASYPEKSPWALLSATDHAWIGAPHGNTTAGMEHSGARGEGEIAVACLSELPAGKTVRLRVTSAPAPDGEVRVFPVEKGQAADTPSWSAKLGPEWTFFTDRAVDGLIIIVTLSPESPGIFTFHPSLD